MSFKKKVIVAIDTNNFIEAKNLIDKIKDHIFGIKIGYEFFLNFGIDGYKAIKEKKSKIFLDLKLHDIPNTVKNGMDIISKLNPYFTTIHISGGDKMIQEAIKNKKRIKILGVSVLTSLDKGQIKKYYRRKNAEDLVKDYVKNAIKNKIDGFICSPHEIKVVRKIAGKNFIIVTPGIRPKNYKSKDDQKRFMSPEEAVSLGADYIVIGRPITKSLNPLEEIKKINFEIAKY